MNRLSDFDGNVNLIDRNEAAVSVNAEPQSVVNVNHAFEAVVNQIRHSEIVVNVNAKFVSFVSGNVLF